MFKTFQRQIEEFNASCSGVLLAAVSGGIDSMVLAHLLLTTVGREGFAIAHCNFHLRDSESDSDTALVSNWARENGVKCHIADFDTRAYAQERSVSIEMAARELRYGWFARLCLEMGYCATAVAHNANDNAETLMLNLLRGTGMDGLGGMEPVSDFPVEEYAAKVKIFRPMLRFTRKQIEGYAFAHGVNYHDDSTNALSEYKRNRIRNEVFPHFYKINPSFVGTLNKDMEYFSQAGDIVRSWCEEAAPKVTSRTISSFGEGLRIDIEALMGTPHWKYLLYYILSPYGFNSPTLSAVEDLLTSGRTVSGKRFESDSHILLAGRGEMTIFPKSCFAVQYEDIMPVRTEGIYNFNGKRFEVKVIPWHKGMSPKVPEGTILLDAEKLKFPFVLRRWRNGDWMRPLGLHGRKLVSDIFTDLKFSAGQKASAVVAVDTSTTGMAREQRIAALVGLRIDEGCKIDSSTVSVIRIRIIPDQIP